VFGAGRGIIRHKKAWGSGIAANSTSSTIIPYKCGLASPTFPYSNYPPLIDRKQNESSTFIAEILFGYDWYRFL
jgi:hypothetical protein